MSDIVKFYTIAFEDGHETVFNLPINDFLNDIEVILENNLPAVQRNVNGKAVRIFSYFRDAISPQRRFVVPFGSLKSGNIYSEGQTDGGTALEKVNLRIYDTNFVYINADSGVVMITCDRSGPKPDLIECYLNTYLPKNCMYKIRIRPIFYNAGIERIRNADQVRSVTFSIDLGYDTNTFINDGISDNDTNIAKYLKSVMDGSKENLDSETIQLTFGLKQRKSSIDIESLLALLDNINIDSDCVREITAHYKDGTNTGITPARLKRSNLEVFHRFSLRGHISPEYLLNNVEEALSQKRNRYSERNREYFRDCEETTESYTLVEIMEQTE